MNNTVNADSFAFPVHCQQLFFSDDPNRQGWKVVCGTEVRGRRGQLHLPQPMPNVLDVGNDAEFAGLQPQVLHTDPVRAPVGEAESNNEAFEGRVYKDAATDEQ